MNPKVDFFFDKATKWQKEFKLLRSIVLDCGLTEELKWGQPCYTFEKANIVLIHGFKEYCAFLFFKGALLKDKKKILIQQTENVQGARQVRFTDVHEIMKLKTTLKTYIYEAVKIEEAGLKVKYKTTSDFKLPGRVSNQIRQKPYSKKSFCCFDAGTSASIPLLFLIGETIKNPGG